MTTAKELKKGIFQLVEQINDLERLKQIYAGLATTDTAQKVSISKPLISADSLKELDDLFKPIRKTISVEDLVREQNFTAIDRVKFDSLIDEMDIQEPLDELIAMI